MSAPIDFAIDVDGVAVLTLGRPERLNALSGELVEAIDDVLGVVEQEKPGALVIHGSGRAFCAGADITELEALAGPSEFSDFVHRLTEVLARLQRLPSPSVAAIHGVALGGGFELSLACDLRVAEAGARLGVPEIKLGLLPGGGGTARLTRMVPPAIAKQLLLTGEPITSEDAHRLGLVNVVAAPGGALDGAIELARSMAGLSAPALAAAKRLVDEGAAMSLTAAVAFERETVSMLFGTPQRTEGISAFLERRSPNFR